MSSALQSIKNKRSGAQPPTNSQIPSQPINRGQPYKSPFPASQNQQIRSGGGYPPQMPPYTQQQQPMPQYGQQQQQMQTTINAQGKQIAIPPGMATPQAIFNELHNRIAGLEAKVKEIDEKQVVDSSNQPSNEQIDFLLNEVGNMKEIILNVQAFSLDIIRKLIEKDGMVAPST